MTKESSQEYSDRLSRLQEIEKRGITPYPARLDFSISSIQEILKDFDQKKKVKKHINAAGRLRSKRLHGALFFGDLEQEGKKIQLYVKKDALPPKQFQLLTELIDVGDFIAVKGIAAETKRGENSILVNYVQLLTKTLRPLPEKWHGLSDIETRFRYRELDLLSNPHIREIFLARTKFLLYARHFLESRHCLEVETPILQTIPGGATAKPFHTHHNALDQDMYLRIAPELFLKRLVVGGIDRVFEIARCFRNEGVDTQHNPEFTQIELYLAYYDFKKLMTLTESFCKYVIKKTLSKENVTFQKKNLNFTPPYPRMTFRKAIQKYCGIDLNNIKTADELKKNISKKDIPYESGWGMGKLLDELFKKYARPNILQPTFITHHPLALSPLAKKDPQNPELVERFQLVVMGMEVCNGFSELNDPRDQKKRFQEQEQLRSKGDEEAQFSDTQYVESLEYGLPPTAGIGIGVDRFIQLLTDSPNIKEVILFPTLRNKKII